MATMDELFGEEENIPTLPTPHDHPTMTLVPPDTHQHPSEGSATMEDLFGDDDDTNTNEQRGTVTVTDLFGEEVNEENDNTTYLASTRAAIPTATTMTPLSRSAADVPRRTTGGTIVNAPGKANLYLPAIPRLAASSSVPSTATPTIPSSLDTLHKKVSLVRLPRIVGISPTIYNSQTYNEAEEDEYLAKADKVAAKEALIRYRLKTVPLPSSSSSSSSSPQYVTDSQGRPQRESNSRVVEWSDGSLTLHVGAEVFSLRRANKATEKNDNTGTPSSSTGDYNYIYSLVNSVNPDHTNGNSSSSSSRSTKESVLESQAVVSNRLVAGAVAGSGIINQSVLEQRASRSRAVKRSRVTQISLTEDPEIEKQRRIKQEEELQRLRIMQKRKAEEAQRKAGGAYDNDIYGTNVGDDDDAMMEDNEDGDNTVNLRALKKNTRNNRKKPVAKSHYTSDDEDSDDDEEEDSDDSSSNDSSDSDSD